VGTGAVTVAEPRRGAAAAELCRRHRAGWRAHSKSPRITMPPTATAQGVVVAPKVLVAPPFGRPDLVASEAGDFVWLVAIPEVLLSLSLSTSPSSNLSFSSARWARIRSRIFASRAAAPARPASTFLGSFCRLVTVVRRFVVAPPLPLSGGEVSNTSCVSRVLSVSV